MAKKKNLFEEKLKEGNWTALFNDILEPVLKSDLTLTDLKVFLFICRKTWGWNKDSEIIRVRDIVEELGLYKSNASEALSSLKRKRLVSVSLTNRYQIQMDTSKWRIKIKSKPQKKNNSVSKSLTKRGQFVSKSLTPVSKSLTTKSEDTSKNANLQSPKDTLKRHKRKTRAAAGEKKSAAVSSLSQKGKPKNQTLTPTLLEYIAPKFNDTGWHTLSRQKLSELILTAIQKGKSDIPNYFRYWKKEIDKRKDIHNKPGLLIKMVEQGNDPPLYMEDEETVYTGIDAMQHYRPGKSRRDGKYKDLYEK